MNENILTFVQEAGETAVLSSLLILLLVRGRQWIGQPGTGWPFVVGGIALLLLGSVMELSQVVLGPDHGVHLINPRFEEYVEKIVGYLGGFSLLAFGLWRWIPSVRAQSEEISKSRRTEQALRESEVKFRAFFEQGGIGARITGPDQVYLDVNQAYADFLGYTREEMIGMTNRDTMPPEEYGRYEANQRLLESGERDSIQFERRFLRKDGGIVWGIVGLAVVSNPDGGIRYRIACIQDITARKRQEEALRATSEHLRGIMDNAADGIITIDEAGIIESVNPATVAMFGYEAEEMVGQNVKKLMPERYAVHHDGHLANYLHTGTGRIVDAGPRELTGRRKDGSEFTMSLAVGELHLDEGVRFIGSIRDVTALKRTEEDLRRSNLHLGLVESIASAANQASVLDEIIPSSLETICTRLDWPVGHAQVSPGSDGDVLVPSGHWYLSDPVRFEAFHKVTSNMSFVRGTGLPGRVLESGKPRWIEDMAKGRRAAAAGKSGLVSGFAFPILAGKRVLAVLEFYTDRILSPDERLLDLAGQIGSLLGRVAERQTAAEASRRSETRLRQIIDLVPHRIFIKDRTGRFRLVNKAMADAFNTTPDEMTGVEAIAIHVDKKIAAEFNAADQEILKSGVPKLLPEVTYPHIDGIKRTLRTMKVPYKESETSDTQILGVSVDVTELKKAEEELRHAQRVEAIGKLTGGIAHDFNNLLTIILGNIQLIVRQVKGETLLKQALNVEGAARRGAELTHRLLAFARRQPLQPKVIDVNDLISDLTELLGRTLGEFIEIETAAAPDLWNTLADPAQVENAVLNLAFNARDAMQDGGRLTIQTINVSLDKTDVAGQDDAVPGRYVMISVADNGAGMESDVIEHAFDPFFTTKKVGRGSGLGLSMVHGFCRQSGGHVTLDSEPEKGTTVRMYLPAADDLADDAGVHPRSKMILVVEDDPEVRSFALTTLDGLGYRVIEAHDQDSAVQALQSNDQIDALITDIVLPGGSDGRNLAHQARDLHPSIRVLYTSGFMLEDPDRADDRYLVRKPYSKQDLITNIDGLFQSLGDERP